MLTRLILAIDGSVDRKRMRSILQRVPDVVAEPLGGGRPRWERLARQAGDVIVVSRSLIPDPVAQHVGMLREVPDAPDLVVLTPGGDAADRAQLLAAGCVAILDGTVADELLGEALAAIVARRRAASLAKLALPQEIGEPRLGDFVSKSPSMQAFMAVVQRVVASDATLLVVGETGVGKERLAQAIHADGPRARGPFIAVNCGAIPENLLESELFGHEEGAFTGASRARRGWFELAHRGTIFLDEVGEMPIHLQVKLLRVLQSHQVIPVGAEKSVGVDVRVMAATNRDLEADAKGKLFRLDLYYRLSVVTLTIPPLRERREDIPILVEKYIQYFQSRFHTTVRSISKEALMALTEYEWPGNVRELVNVIERAMLLCSGERITLRELPGAISGRRRSGAAASAPGELLDAAIGDGWTGRPLREVRRDVVDAFERAYIDAVLRETGGRMDETASRAGMNVRNLFDKLRRLGLRKEDYRRGRERG